MDRFKFRVWDWFEYAYIDRWYRIERGKLELYSPLPPSYMWNWQEGTGQ